MHQEMLPVQEKLFGADAIPAYDLASTCAALGKDEDALRYLQAAFDRRDMKVMFLNDELNFNALHDNAAYKEIAARIHERLPKANAQ